MAGCAAARSARCGTNAITAAASAGLAATCSAPSAARSGPSAGAATMETSVPGLICSLLTRSIGPVCPPGGAAGSDGFIALPDGAADLRRYPQPVILHEVLQL